MDSELATVAIVSFLIGLSAAFGIVAVRSGESPIVFGNKPTALTISEMTIPDGTAVYDMNSSMNGNVLSKDSAERLVNDWLTANEVHAAILSVGEESGLYKLAVMLTESNGTTYLYMTKDGNLLLQSGVADLKSTTAQLVARRAFFDCLSTKGLKFYGSTEYNSTLLQLQMLGGTQFVDRIYVPCEGERAQACVDANVTEVPTFVLENESYTGVRTVDWFLNITGCTIG